MFPLNYWDEFYNENTFTNSNYADIQKAIIDEKQNPSRIDKEILFHRKIDTYNFLSRLSFVKKFLTMIVKGDFFNESKTIIFRHHVDYSGRKRETNVQYLD